VIWKQPPKGDVLQYEGGTTVDPNLPFLHIVHYNALHFEALAPLDGRAVNLVEGTGMHQYFIK
jgi:hypothetical protein